MSGRGEQPCFGSPRAQGSVLVSLAARHPVGTKRKCDPVLLICLGAPNSESQALGEAAAITRALHVLTTTRSAPPVPRDIKVAGFSCLPLWPEVSLPPQRFCLPSNWWPQPATSQSAASGSAGSAALLGRQTGRTEGDRCAQWPSALSCRRSNANPDGEER